MKVTVKLKVVVDATTIMVSSYVRYWGNADVNGKSDNPDNPNMPCAVKSIDNGSYYWKPIIDIESGQILNWEHGVTASIHYKVCDEFSCKIVGSVGGVINNITDYEGYVPRFMCPKEEGYGDYIIMDINENGYIKDWNNTDVVRFIEQEG